MGKWVGSDIDVTEMLQAWRHGDEAAFQQLVETSYDALHHMARGRLAGREPATLTPTDLVSEAFLVLLQRKGFVFRNRDQFQAVVSLVMRDVVKKRLRARKTQKRGGEQALITFDEEKYDPEEALALNEMLDEFAKREPRKALIVQLHYFWGIPFEEIAGLLGLSERTVFRDWKLARLWLYDAIKKRGAS